ncbi:MAG: hypothetical protein O2970_10435 [Proteobacteria bacterium]|nr:hypothetical protein [Pseudomonadota bacterium]MDA0967358.1 hypothetical protein [Pseudomonadota bacterium]
MKKKYVVLSVIGSFIVGITLVICIGALGQEFNMGFNKTYFPDKYYEQYCGGLK